MGQAQVDPHKLIPSLLRLKQWLTTNTGYMKQHRTWAEDIIHLINHNTELARENLTLREKVKELENEQRVTKKGE